MGWLLGAGLLALAMLGGSSSRVRTSPSSRRRGRADMGDVETTADLQARRLGIGVDLWQDLRTWSYGPARRRQPFRGITGPADRIESWLSLVRDDGREGRGGELEAEAETMDREGAHVAAEYARSLARR